MSQSDPLTLTINAVPFSLARIQTGSVLTGSPSVYQNSDETVTETITNQKTKGSRHRHRVRVDQRAIVTNPLDSAADYDSISAEVIIDRPDYGFTVTQVDQLLAALKAQLTTAFVTKLYGNES